MKKQKKHGLFYALVVCFLAYVVLSWIIPVATVSSGTFTENGTSPVGIFGLIYYPAITLGTFAQYGFIILAIGALYGVMAKTGVYAKLVNNVAKKYIGNEKTLLIVIIGLITLVSSLVGLPFILYIIAPFLLAILAKVGYNKITRVAAVFGSMLIGEVGSTLGFDVAGMTKIILGLEVSEWILFKLGLLIVILVLFVLFVLGNKETRLEKNTVKKTEKKTKETKKVEIAKEEVKKEDILFLEDAVEGNKSSLPLVILFTLLIILAVVSMYNINYVFGFTFFEDLYEQITSIAIKGYPLFQNILGLTGAFGNWDSYELITILVGFSLLIGWVYNLKLNETVDAMVNGLKKVVKPAFLITFANVLFIMMIANSNGTIVTYVTNKLASATEDVNFITSILSGVFGSLFYNNFNYMLNDVGAVYSVAVGTSCFSVLSFILQCTYGVMMMVLPTSLILVLGLSMEDVSFKEWISYIWKYALQLFIIVVVLSVIILLIV